MSWWNFRKLKDFGRIFEKSTGFLSNFRKILPNHVQPYDCEHLRNRIWSIEMCLKILFETGNGIYKRLLAFTMLSE